MTGAAAPEAVHTFEADFEALFAIRYPELFRLLDRLTGDAAQAADVAQEAFVRLFERRSMPDDPRAWLAAVALNLVRDEGRRTARRRRLLLDRPAEDTMGDAPAAADEAVIDRERAAAVRVALDALPERQRKMLLLHAEGFSYREIAAVLAIAESSVGVLLMRARAAFRLVLDQEGHPCT